MEKNRICRICNRRFSNGKAMGGHMRSHLAKLPLPPKPIIIPEDQPPPKSPSYSSSLNYPSVDRYQHRKQSYRSVNHDPPFMSKSNLAIEHEEEGEEDEEFSETDESRRNPTRRRSKRRRKSSESVVRVAAESESPEQVSSSISDIFNEEDVALCLLMLSRDKLRRKMKQVAYENIDYYIEDEQVEVSTDAEEDEDESFGEIRVRSKSQGRYKCETCNKWFRSYQALGGHKASHRKIKTTATTHMRVDEGSSGNAAAGDGGGMSIEHRTFKCPFCDKVFESGQALGGHKKVHFSYLGNNNNIANANYSRNAKFKSSNKLLDLNLPAPEDDGEVSQADISNLSNTKPYHLRN